MALEDFLIGPILAVVWALFAWLYARTVNRAAKLDRFTAFQRFGILYGSWFFLGMGYILMVASAFRIPEWMWMVLIVLWIALLGTIAYWRYRRKRLRAGA